MKKLFVAFTLFIGGVATILLFLFGSSLLLSFPVKWLWNWVMVDIFHMAQIGYWQAFGLFMLTGLLIRNTNTIKKENKDK